MISRWLKVICQFTKVRIWIVFCIWAVLSGLAPAWAGPAVSGIRLGEHRSYTRIVIDLTAAAAFQVRSLKAPYRIYVDIDDASVRLAQTIQDRIGIIGNVRYGRMPNGDARIVFDTRGPARVLKARLYPPLGRLGHRLAIDLQRQSPAAFDRGLGTVLADGTTGQPAARPALATLVSPELGASTATDRPRLVRPVPAERTARPTAPVSDATGLVRPVPATRAKPLAAAMPAPINRVEATPATAPVPPAAPVRVAPRAADPPPRQATTTTPASRPAAGTAGSRKSDTAVAGTAVAGAAPAAAATPVPTAGGLLMIAPPPAGITRPSAPPPVRRMVVIDPGHGGNDPGAIGKGGLREKDFTLTMSRKLRDTLLATGRYEVRMTRDRDEFVRLRTRVAMARDFADGRPSDQVLFISIHADSIRKSQIRGMSVYTLSEKASDAEAEDLANRENRADLVAGHDLSDVDDPDVANILVELALEESKRVARNFASALVSELAAAKVRLLKRPQRSAGFAVLKAPDIPSVLVELGYLSNKRDERLLRDATHRRKLADAMRSAIDRHFDGLKVALVQ